MSDTATLSAPSPAVDKNRLLTVAELCAWWRCSRKHIWELRTKRKGDDRLPSYKVGRHILFSYDECCFYLQKLAVA